MPESEREELVPVGAVRRQREAHGGRDEAGEDRPRPAQSHRVQPHVVGGRAGAGHQLPVPVGARGRIGRREVAGQRHDRRGVGELRLDREVGGGSAEVGERARAGRRRRGGTRRGRGPPVAARARTPRAGRQVAALRRLATVGAQRVEREVAARLSPAAAAAAKNRVERRRLQHRREVRAVRRRRARGAPRSPVAGTGTGPAGGDSGAGCAKRHAPALAPARATTSRLVPQVDDGGDGLDVGCDARARWRRRRRPTARALASAARATARRGARWTARTRCRAARCAGRTRRTSCATLR